MTRLAAGRSTHLEPEEIATETLRLFDEGGDPSIRQLAVALNVTPSAIYHHYSSRAEIVQAAVELVWREVLTEATAQLGNPFEADPTEVLVTLGMVARQAFIRHHSITPYMAAIPRSDELSAAGMSIFANVFERLGVSGPEAGEAFHYYASYCLGTSLYAASRLTANESLGTGRPGHEELEEHRVKAGLDSTSSPETRAALDAILDLSEIDPERDDALFEAGLRQILGVYAKA
ncbi:MAG: TetR/AcrR family transcriptional regulator [Solirubrobacterales bacterium]|nr:TetR/AcrR family transcriptional regulator [Solirubrobacterales bacterium]